MPTKRTKLTVRKPRTARKGSSLKKKQRPAVTHKQSPRRRTGPQAGHHQVLIVEPYIYECTRPGCGYRIWRDDKAETGEHRFDLKCPKCHNKEFRCLGKGDVPETFDVVVPSPSLDLDNINPIDLGTN